MSESADGPFVAWLGRLVRGEVAWPRVLLVTLSAVLVVAVAVLLATSTAAFGAYNPGWEGGSDFRSAMESETDAEVVQSTAVYDDVDPDSTVAFVVAPDAHYTGDDAQRVAAFVEAGGTLVVLENFGSAGNALLADVGAEARLDGQLLRDEREYGAGPAMPLVPVESDHPATEGVDELALNYATAIEPGEATVLAETSPYAYVGPADTELEDATLGSQPVVTAEPVGDGTVIVVADPSLTINAMYDESDNAAFLAGLAGEGDRVLLDVSQADRVPALWSAVLTLRGSPIGQLLVGLGLLAALAAVGRSRGSVGRRIRAIGRGRGAIGRDDPEVDDPGLSPGERAALVRERHPEWSKNRVQRSITALNRTPEKGERE